MDIIIVARLDMGTIIPAEISMSTLTHNLCNTILPNE